MLQIKFSLLVIKRYMEELNIDLNKREEVTQNRKSYLQVTLKVSDKYNNRFS